MSQWEDLGVEQVVLEVLEGIHPTPGGHHFGRPFLTAYQLAIKVYAAAPQIAATLGVEVGGLGTGARTSLAQYLARELSRRVRDGAVPVEGAFVSNDNLEALIYKRPDGQRIESSLTTAGFDLSLFRLDSAAQQ